MKYHCPLFTYRAKGFKDCGTVWGELVANTKDDSRIRGWSSGLARYDTFDVDYYTLSCCIFLDDSKGVPMYTGDIVKVMDECDEETFGLLGEIYYDREEASFMIDFHNYNIDGRYINKVAPCYEVVWNNYAQKYEGIELSRPEYWTNE